MTMQSNAKQLQSKAMQSTAQAKAKPKQSKAKAKAKALCVCVSVSVYVSVCMSDMGDKYCSVFLFPESFTESLVS